LSQHFWSVAKLRHGLGLLGRKRDGPEMLPIIRRGEIVILEGNQLFQLPIQVYQKGKLRVCSDCPNYWVAFPWPESDRLDGHRWATVSAMITIGKVHTWDTGSACFEPPNEERSGGGSPVSQISPEGDRSRIACLNGRLVVVTSVYQNKS
jgi:hypothetical protein